MGKSRKSSEGAADQSATQDEDGQLDKSRISWEERTRYLSPVSQPLASKKLTKKLYKLIKKAKDKNSLSKGVKEVQKSLRKGEKGLVVLAGDVSPVDILTHIPVVCEEANVAYIYTPSKAELGESYGSKRSACMVLVKQHKELSEEIQECKTKIDEIPLPY